MLFFKSNSRNRIWQFAYDRRKILIGSIAAGTLSFTLSSAFANEFWANQLGGGFEDVLVEQLLPSGYESRSNADWIEPE